MSRHRVAGREIAAIPRNCSFSGSDLRRLDQAIHAARSASTVSASSLVAPHEGGGEARRLTDQNCVFDHSAVLLFPRTADTGLDTLERRGLAPLPTTPSTAVRRRLSERYGLDEARCAIEITRLRLSLPDGRVHPAVEVFLFPREQNEFVDRIEAAETRYGFEDHTAFVVPRPDAGLLTRLTVTWRREAGLVWEGGAHNPHEGGPGGSTVLYFIREHDDPERPRRIELHCAGDLTAFIDQLTLDTEAVNRVYGTWRRAGDPPFRHSPEFSP
jgi:hypothetical protein